ncbi:MAG: AAA family ATPase [Leptolyngbyaceae cyanobacterium RU_5_1]|nr:AAA family ATPase [Leptolyngbyaceae cyanobacterium RU_5_1]
MTYFDPYEGSYNSRQPQAQGLLSSGWRPFYRQLDLMHLANLVFRDNSEFTQKAFNLTSNLANAAGRNEYTWWANVLNLFSSETRYHVDEFWSYITPDPPYPDYRFPDVLSVETPIKPMLSRDCIAIDHVFSRLREIIILKILKFLGCPKLITQYYLDRHFYYPTQHFVSWERLDVINNAYAYWEDPQVWLQIDNLGKERRLSIMARDLKPLVQKVAHGLAVVLSGYQSRVGQIQSQYPIRSFPKDIQDFTDAVQQAILDQEQLAVLVSGEPGTGKTVWTQAVAKEVLVPLGYVTFILDHEAVQNFVPPNYLERVCLIINEADNLAQDRSMEVAQYNNKTEHILSLLDGTLYRSVIDEMGMQTEQRLVVLMTCNTTERFDPAMLRKGRVDLTCEFTHRFV